MSLSIEDIQTIGVVGAGQMGSGIAHVAATAGYAVVVNDVSEAALQRCRSTIEKNLARQVKKERLSETQATAALEAVVFSSDQQRLQSTQLIVEAATENVELKYRIFESLSQVADPTAIFCDQHLVDFDYSDWISHRSPGSTDGYAFYESRSGDETR